MVSPKNSHVVCMLMGFYSLRSLEFCCLVIDTRYPALMVRAARLLLSFVLLWRWLLMCPVLVLLLDRQ